MTPLAAGLAQAVVEEVVRRALAEDVGAGDVTTEALVPPEARCRAELVVREPGVVCGVPVAAAVFATLDPDARVEAVVEEGQRLGGASVVARVDARARAVLTGERTALNLLGRLSGVATLTRAFVEQIDGTGAVLLDTRKTTPGLRALEKYATRTGGARNHRLGLDDGVLIKDNHLRLARGITAAVHAVRAHRPDLAVEVEVETLDEVSEALAAGADVLLLDNMTTDAVAAAVALVAGRARLEASGGVSLATVRAVAETGVDFVSAGALTHAARSLDVSLEVP